VYTLQLSDDNDNNTIKIRFPVKIGTVKIGQGWKNLGFNFFRFLDFFSIFKGYLRFPTKTDVAQHESVIEKG